MKNKTLLIIGAFVLAIMLGIGLTYAYFAAKITGNENASTITLESGELSITMDGTNTINTPEKLIPDSEDPFSTKVVTVTGKNTAINLNMPYTLKIVVDENTFTAGSIKYTITGVNNSNSGVIIPNMEMQTVDSTLSVGSGLFVKGDNQIHTYTLKFYFPDTGQDQSTNMGAKFRAHIEISGDEAEEPAPKGWWKADSATLLGALRENTVVHKDTDEGMTKPGVDNAEEDEQLRMTLDDYGTSYYFRGAVENNYLVFANKCWRIVRIDGNGNTKLFYWGNVTNNKCEAADNTLKTPFNNKKWDGLTNSSADFFERTDVYTSNRPAGIGFMYGDVMGTTYASVHANTNDSDILDVLQTWYDQTFTTEALKGKLADVIWCNDKSLASNNTGNGAEFDTTTVFKARERLYAGGNITKASPTLICPETYELNGTTYNIGKLSKFTANDRTNGNGALKGYKIGLITADEAAFAGSTYSDINNIHYYLYTGDTYWTMSPTRFLNGDYLSYIILVNYNGKLVNLSVTTQAAVHPTISLIPSIGLTDTPNQDGTTDHPYVID